MPAITHPATQAAVAAASPSVTREKSKAEDSSRRESVDSNNNTSTAKNTTTAKNDAATARADRDTARLPIEQETLALQAKPRVEQQPKLALTEQTQTQIQTQSKALSGDAALRDIQGAAAAAAKAEQKEVSRLSERQSLEQGEQTMLAEEIKKPVATEQQAADAEPIVAAQAVLTPAESEPALRSMEKSTPTAAFVAKPVTRSNAPEACHALSVIDCVSSPVCILQWESDSTTYSCRAPENVCEQNFIQLSNKSETCEATAGCVFTPAQCFCLPGTQCECSDGPPAMCSPQTLNE
jgi:hypothetical protein